MNKLKLLAERIEVCYYVLTAPTFAFFSCGGEKNPRRKMKCYEQNVFRTFNEAVAMFAENDYEENQRNNMADKAKET